MTPGFDMFLDRADAGRRLAAKLRGFPTTSPPLLLALPRGGVPVAAKVAAALGLPFDVLVVRKLGVPGHEEYAMGAIAGGGVMMLDHEVVARLGVSLDALERVVAREERELERRERNFRGGLAFPQVAGRTVIVVDDGIATGSTMSAAVALLRKQNAGRIVVAVPVAADDSAERLRGEADEVVTLLEPGNLGAVGRWYRDFGQTGDDEVRRLLEESRTARAER
ncbi:MAG TPA: phosphoribosyltransferase family protein [Luteolibacter sp.]|nr:phosphoribosyltransferase family protein [Luteolibacter sp.]